jgi:hypothetical protein
MATERAFFMERLESTVLSQSSEVVKANLKFDTLFI